MPLGVPLTIGWVAFGWFFLGGRAMSDLATSEVTGTTPVDGTVEGSGNGKGTAGGIDLGRPIKFLRADALKGAMETRVITPAQVAKAKYVDDRKKRSIYVCKVRGWCKALTIVPDEELDFLAEQCGVSSEVLRVRDLTDRERMFQNRARRVFSAAARRSRSARRKVAAPATKVQLPRRGKTTVQLQFSRATLAAAVANAKSIGIETVGSEIVLRIPLTREIALKAMNLPE